MQWFYLHFWKYFVKTVYYPHCCDWDKGFLVLVVRLTMPWTDVIGNLKYNFNVTQAIPYKCRFSRFLSQCPTLHQRLCRWQDGYTQRVNSSKAKWRPVVSDISQRSMVGLELFNIFVSDRTVESSAPQQVCWWQQGVCCSWHTAGKGCHPEGLWQAWEVDLCSCF